ncbi:23S rRNA (guanine(745)-N(1))-methyltransferase [Pseudoalteromonas fenneropenaei]|uniref:23S rRNA (Guanine(745)-N(1))-methyltransferase n=1 Tax=Pseudoalteromonas fenneropenaei TaxID=1737459 RepID=A0ABV7CF74_9GAMM
MSMLYRCPLCGLALHKQEHAYFCDNRHQFDIAKEHYVNLLPVQFKKSKDPGDNLAMVQARRQFLASGHYQFMCDALAKRIATDNPSTLLDMGCGEGFYTSQLANQIRTQVHGIDISKAAIRYAAKRYQDCHFAVASAKQSPFQDHSFDAIVSIFAPLFVEECLRLLKPDGLVYQVSPGPRHLFELKSCIYQQVNLHQAPQAPAGMHCVDEIVLEKQVVLTEQEALDLIYMTPFAWKFQPEHLAELRAQAKIVVTLSFIISALARDAA